ncbi:MAG: hypothetical protein H8D45_26100 [Bacteroidetes bacterium]|nr:hypothetical protein [Bacteroidota bacterium]
MFKKKVPIKFGFKINDQIVSKMEVTSGDPEKRIIISFKNKERFALTSIVFDIKFHRPLSLSGTDHALTIMKNRTSTESSDKYYKITYFDIPIYPDEPRDIPTELNTKGKVPGDYKISVSVVSTNDKYKKKKKDLILSIK